MCTKNICSSFEVAVAVEKEVLIAEAVGLNLLPLKTAHCQLKTGSIRIRCQVYNFLIRIQIFEVCKGGYEAVCKPQYISIGKFFVPDPFSLQHFQL